MANTFLKRKITVRRLFEIYSSKIPVWGHLFLVLSGFSLLLAKTSNWQELYYGSSSLAGPLGILLLDSMLTLPSFVWGAVAALGVTACALVLSDLDTEPALASFWALLVMCASLVFPLSKSMWLESIMMVFIGMLLIVSQKLRNSSNIRLNVFFALLLILSVLLYLPSLLLVPLFVNFVLGKKIPDLRRRIIYSVLIGITSAVALVGIALIARIHFWNYLTMTGLWEFPLALWTIFFSPGRSIFLYSPVLLIALVGYSHMIDSEPDFARFLTGLIVVSITGILLLEGSCSRQAWSGEPLIPFIPMFMIPAVWVNLERPLTKYFCVFIIILGLLFQFLLFTPVHSENWRSNEVNQVYLPSGSPLFKAVRNIVGK
jgi:hypothetical protein